MLFFPNTYDLVGQYVAEDAVVVVRGRVDRRDEQARLMAMDLKLPDITVTASNAAKPVVLQLPSSRCTPSSSGALCRTQRPSRSWPASARPT